MLAWLFPHNPTQRAISIAVCATHLAILGFLFLGQAFTSAKPKHRPLIVKTITPRSAISAHDTSLSQGKGRVSKKENLVSAPTAKPQASAVKPVAKKTALSSVKQPQKKSEQRAKIPDSLAKELEESIAKIEKKTKEMVSKSKSHLAHAAVPIQLQIDHGEVEEDSRSSYIDSLTLCLHESLKLPEFGAVTMQLTLRQDGSVVKLKVLKAESQKNKNYLEANLPQLRFPHLDGSFAKEKESTFVLTFCNEI
jgi:hypothetical protein